MRSRHRMQLVLACASLFFLVAVGCDSQPAPVPISGKVTFKGAPVGQGRIEFLPIKTSEGAPAYRPMTSGLDSDGKYELSMFRSGDGAMPGEYEVVIISILSGPTMFSPKAPTVWAIPKHYSQPGQSGLLVTVPAQRAAVTLDFELTK